MFMNINILSLGLQQNFNRGEEGIKHVLQDAFLLPNWSLNSFDFVRVMREALESDYVTKNLANWIDLTFGSL